MLDLKTGDVANADSISEWLFERVKKAYGNLGHIQMAPRLGLTIHLKKMGESAPQSQPIRRVISIQVP